MGAGGDLTDREAAVLLAATRGSLAEAGARGGAIGGPFGSLGAERAGAAGGRFGAHFTRPRSAEVVVEVQDGAEAVLDRVRAAIGDRGTEIADPNGADDATIVWGLVASGALDMVPALVRVAVDPTATGARAHVRATGREGPIRQGIASKAVERLCAALQGGAA